MFIATGPPLEELRGKKHQKYLKRLETFEDFCPLDTLTKKLSWKYLLSFESYYLSKYYDMPKTIKIAFWSCTDVSKVIK